MTDVTASNAESVAFYIDAMSTDLHADPAAYRDKFLETPVLYFRQIFAPRLLQSLVERAASASFIDDDVYRVGQRAIEANQRVGKSISLLLARQALLDWLEDATDIRPLRATAGRLVQTRANSRDELVWHDDMGHLARKLAVVINLSDTPFEGGVFELRAKGSETLLFSHKHVEPGAMLVFAVRPELEHRVTPLTAGGPRRVYAGWFLAKPEFDDDPLATGKIFDP
jgi:hypothetical protein